MKPKLAKHEAGERGQWQVARPSCASQSGQAPDACVKTPMGILAPRVAYLPHAASDICHSGHIASKKASQPSESHS